MTDPKPLQIDQLIARLDWDLQTLFKMVERLCAEVHLDDASIKEMLAERDSARLEIISDTADEVLVKATSLITEARLAIRTTKRGGA